MQSAVDRAAALPLEIDVDKIYYNCTRMDEMTH